MLSTLEFNKHRLAIKKIFYALCIGIGVYAAHAQQFVWKSYTTLTGVSSVAIDRTGKYWAATSGGAFQVDPSSNNYNVYRNINALSTISLSAVAADPATGVVAFGGSSGELDFLSPDGTWHHSLDIKNNEQLRTINDLMFADSTLFIAADFGISTYNVRLFAFITTAVHLGPIAAGTRATSLALWNNTLFVGTDTGVAYTPVNSPNIADASYWSIIPYSQLPGAAVTSLATSNKYVYIGTKKGLCFWDGSSIHPVSGAAGNAASVIVAVASEGDTTYAATASTIYMITSDSISSAISLTIPSPITGLAFDKSRSALEIGTNANGLQSYAHNSTITFAPNGPGGNYISSTTFDSHGILWAATAHQENSGGNGLYRYDGSTWKSFRTDSTPQLPTNAILTVCADSLGNVWTGTFGAGLVKTRDSGNTIATRSYNQNNSPFSGIAGSASFILVAQSQPDASNIQWIVPFRNESGQIRPHLIAYDPSRDTIPGNPANAMFAFANPAVSTRWFWGVAIDNQGTKWLCGTPDGGFGNSSPPPAIMYFNERNTLNVTSDDIWGVVDHSTGLSSDNTTAVAIDQDDELWVGSTTGVDIITNPDAVLTNPQSVHIIKPYLSLLSGGTTYITAIMVDQLNNKWIGTNGSGLLVVSPDGSQLLETFTHENSPLLSDNVLSLSQDPHTGTVYAGTPSGLSSVTNSPIASAASTNLRIGPQPFIIPTATPMNIFGVNPNAEVKIFTVSGRLVRDFAPGVLNDLGGPGGWDGKDVNGNWVASGIYFLVEVNSDGTMQEKKMAVIHQ